MSGKKATKILSIVLIALMLFSGFGVLASASGAPSALPVSQSTTTTTTDTTVALSSSGVVHHTPAWLEKIDPSLREPVLNQSKGTVDITVLTTDAGLLNKYMSDNLDKEFLDTTSDGHFMRSTISVRNSHSSVPVTKVLTVPYSQIKSIASLPGVVGVYNTEHPKPAVINNPILQEENSGLHEDWNSGDKKIPSTYSSPVNGAIAQEHHATDAWAKGYDGTGVNVAVVDTGVDFANPDLIGQWAVDENASSPYYGWPIMWDPVSMDNMMSLFTSDQDNVLFDGRMPYPIYASYGESSWYSDTSYETQAQHNTTTGNYTVTYKPYGGFGYPNKRVDPNGYGPDGVNMSFISRTYYIGNDTSHIVSKSGIYHMGLAKDDYLTSIYGTRVGMLVVDAHTAGVYDTVYVDLNNDGDFTDDTPVTKANPLATCDLNGDGVPDLSGGLLYFISNTEGSVTGENLTVVDGTAKLSHGDIVSDVTPEYGLEIKADLYINGKFMPSYSDTLYQDVVTNGTGVSAGTSINLADQDTYEFFGLGIPGNDVNLTYLFSQGYGIRNLDLYYGNATGEVEMTESSTPGNISLGMFNYSYDANKESITINFDMEPGSYIYAIINMDTYKLDFNTGEITFITAPPAGARITADYSYGLPIPYSRTYTERMGYDNFIPASGDVVAFFGDFDIDQGFPHGTFCASNIVGTMNNIVQGTAPGAKIIGIGDFYNSASYDAWYFAVEGYDGNVSTSDDQAQIVSNSFGGGTVNTGWSYSSRLVYDITTNYAPHATFVAAAGNEGWGYGTVGNPGASPGVVTVGAGVNMAYRWLFGYDGGESNDWVNYFFPDSSWYGDVADFSSKGPTALGTPDPDVLAVGEFGIGGAPVNYAITEGWGADGTGAWDLWSGTSLATPVTAGVLALEYQAYYDNHNHTWPSNDVAKNILTSSCDDHGYDVLEQGAGWVNASRAVDMAAEANGVSADRMYWVPGGYDGTSHQASINLLRPGESDTTTMTLTNHNPTASADVTVSDAIYNRTAEYTFDLPTYFAAQDVLKPDGLYAADGATPLNKSLWTPAQWDSADFIKITAYTNQTDAYPYMNLFDWYRDTYYPGGNETAFYSEISTVENQTIIVGHYGETYAYFNNSNLLPGAPILVYSNGTLLNNSAGGNYTIDLSTGKITFLNDTGAIRPLNPGEIINMTYTHYMPVKSGDSYLLSSTPVHDYTVWLNRSGTIINWTSSEGTNFTFDAATGNITLMTDLQPGDIVTVNYDWGTPGVYDGSIERIRTNVDLQHANMVTASIYNPGKRIDHGLVLTMYDVNSIFLGAPPKLYDFKVTVEFYQKADWSWISESASSLTIPAGGTASLNITASVPSDAGVGSYQGAIVIDNGGQISLVPVLINVPATEFPVHFGGNVPTTSLYNNNAMQGIHGGEYTGGGDWRFFFVDTSGLSVADNKKLITMLYWNGVHDDSEIYLMQAQPDPAGFSGGEYGPFTMTEVAHTKEFVGATDTLVPGSEILHADMMDGPFEIAVRNWQLTGDVPYSQFHGDFGYMQTSPTDLQIYTNNLTGRAPITVSSNIDLYKGVGSAVTASSQTVFAKQPVDPYPFPGGSYEVYLANAPNHVNFNMPEGVISVKFSLYFYNGANDVDMGVYYDANGDGIAEPDELVIPDSETATLNNPEVGTMMFPKAGPYIINAAGYDVAPGSLYDLTITLLQVASGSAFSLNATTETIPAGTPSTAYVEWDFGNSAPTEPMSSLLLVSPGCAPYALVQPVTINLVYDDQAPTFSNPSPAVGAVITDSSAQISLSYSDNLAGVDTGTVTMTIDGNIVHGTVSDNSVSYQASSLSDGMHVVSVTASDMAGNPATYEWAFYVKTSSSGGGEEVGQPPGGIPENSISLPPTGSSEEGAVAPGMYITSPSLTNQTEYTLTGITAPGVMVSSGSSETYSNRFGQFSLPISLIEGDNAISITVTDSDGVEFYYTFDVVLDTTAPQISFNLRNVVTTPDLEIQGKVSDDHMKSLDVNGMPVKVYADGSFVALVSLQEGVNTIVFTATDAAGNVNTVVRNVTLDTTPPSIVISAPAIVTGNNTVTITITAPDAVSVTVNGVPATSNGDGTWTYTASLTPGGNTFYVVAEDRYGNSGQATKDITYTPPVNTVVTETGYSKTTTYMAGIGALILGLIIGIVIAMLLWGGKKPEEGEAAPVEAFEEEETAPEEEELPEGEATVVGAEDEELEDLDSDVGEDIPEIGDDVPEAEEEGDDLDFDVDDSDSDIPDADEEGEAEEEGDVIDIDLDNLD